MSVNFQDEVSPEAIKRMAEVFGEPVATDKRLFLYDQMREIEQSRMKELANMTKQPVTVEMNAPGEIKTMSDGTKYEVTEHGWKRVR